MIKVSLLELDKHRNETSFRYYVVNQNLFRDIGIEFTTSDTYDFASQKNYLKNMCSGDYSFNLDADEMVSHWFMKDIHEILEGNEVDLIYVPRINTVDGITEEHCRMYGYQINEKGWINYPDWQPRIFRNRPNIRWEKPVHERIVGFQTYAHLPMEQKYSIIHPKTIERQVEQNKFYNEEITAKLKGI